jgi:tRNA(adenine34) deaminase
MKLSAYCIFPRVQSGRTHVFIFTIRREIENVAVFFTPYTLRPEPFIYADAVFRGQLMRLTEKEGRDRRSKMAIDFSQLMKHALREAEKGFEKGEVPIGALLCDPDGKIVAKAHNLPISHNDPTAHAEILVLRGAGAFYNNYRLTGSTLVVTLEPCIMCMGAAFHARISRLVFGAFDPKSGAAGSLYDLPQDRRFNHRMDVVSGIMEKESSRQLQDFFQLRREKHDALELHE